MEFTLEEIRTFIVFIDKDKDAWMIKIDPRDITEENMVEANKSDVDKDQGELF